MVVGCSSTGAVLMVTAGVGATGTIGVTEEVGAKGYKTGVTGEVSAIEEVGVTSMTAQLVKLLVQPQG